MGAIRTAANTTYRDYNTDGVSGSGAKAPVKSDIRSLFGTVEDSIGGVSVVQVSEPATAPSVALGSAGALTGDYYYSVTFVTATGETDRGPVSSLISPSAKRVTLTNIPTSADASVTSRRIYRTVANPADSVQQKLVTTIADNVTTTYTDNTADGSLGVNIPYINTTGVNTGYWYQNAKVLGRFGTQSMFVGYGSGTSNSGYSNTGFGVAVLPSNTTGHRNVGLGLYSLYTNTTGCQNTAAGVHALNYQTTASNNTAFGYAAGMGTIAGEQNVFVGAQANQGGTAPYYGVYIGYQAGFQSAGARCTIIGSEAAFSLTSSNDVTAIGYRALKSGTGASNTAVGKDAGLNVTTGASNTLVGDSATGPTTGSSNSVLGASAGGAIAAGGTNTMLGAASGVSGAGISGAVYVGYGSGYYETASNKFFIDNQTRTNEATARTDSLMYGVFNATASSQTLNIAAATTIRYTLNVASSVATPAGGSTSARLTLGTTSGFGVYYGSGAPTVSAAKGSLYLRSDGSSTSTRMYVNTDGGTTWTNVTTAA